MESGTCYGGRRRTGQKESVVHSEGGLHTIVNRGDDIGLGAVSKHVRKMKSQVDIRVQSVLSRKTQEPRAGGAWHMGTTAKQLVRPGGRDGGGGRRDEVSQSLCQSTQDPVGPWEDAGFSFWLS